MTRTLVIAALAATAAFADEATLLRWMDRIAQEQLRKRSEEIARIKTPEDAGKRKQFVHAKILELIGGLPDYSGPLNPRVAGQVQRAGYVIEKVMFDSLPGIYVTANLYRPTTSGKHAAILMPMGHWENGKSAGQRLAANFALKGFVVLAYDPVGQGERLQAYDARLGRSEAGGGTEQHFINGGQSILLGQSFARYRIWDAKRALDYLVSRVEVDRERIGATGCSGGGTITTYISALDDRIKVAAPSCYMNSFRTLFTGSVGDSEQSLPGFLSSGLDQTDYVELFAPKPWLISSTAGDFFTPAGAEQVYQEGRNWYRIYGAEDKIKWVVGPGGHGTPLEVRKAIYGWMNRWLQGGAGNTEEQTVELAPEYELQVTRTGQVIDEPGARDLYQYIRETPRSPKNGEDLLSLVRGLVRYESRAPVIRQQRENEVTFETEPGLDVSATITLPRRGGAKNPAVLLVEHGPGTNLPAKLAAAGNIVLSVQPRGTPAKFDPRSFSGPAIMNTRALLIGRVLPAMRALDILRALDVLAAREDVDTSRIEAYAGGTSGIWLLLAASIDGRIRKIHLDRTPHSFAAALEAPVLRHIYDGLIPGFALHGDLADLVDSSRVMWTDPVNWTGSIVRLQGPQYRYRSGDANTDEIVPF